ncbi:MAG: nucleotidyltransferase family protein [Elusimicrobia bacterium]|nr:nucleotidyltransferase family protein [Elusimicrobiota bacterium]
MPPIQAVVVAGGLGSRMGRSTERTPKSMLRLAGKPILEHILAHLAASGIAEAHLCLGHGAAEIMDYFGDGSRWNLALGYSVEDRPLGTAGAVKALEQRLDDEFLVVYGDLYIELDIRRLIRFHRGHDGDASIVVSPTDHPYDSDLLRVRNGIIRAFFRAAPGQARPEALSCIAVWGVRKALLGMIPNDVPSDFGRDIFPAAIRAGRRLMAYESNETVLDLGTPQRLARAEHLLLSRTPCP